MPIEILGDDFMAEVLAECLADKAQGNAAIVFVEKPPVLSAFNGLDDAIYRAPSGVPILILGFSYPWMLAVDRRFHLAMSYGNVRYDELPMGLEDIEQLVADAVAGKLVRPTNRLVQRVFSLPDMQDVELATIRHDLHHAQNAPEGSDRREEMDARWLPKAQRLFGALGREALIMAIEAVGQTKTDYAPLAGEKFDTVCCDIEGTLFREGAVNQALLAELNELATKRPVVLWTGGDLKAIDNELRRLHIALPLIPKQLARGVSVAVAIDDLPEAEFVDIYGINVGEYRRV